VPAYLGRSAALVLLVTAALPGAARPFAMERAAGGWLAVFLVTQIAATVLGAVTASERVLQWRLSVRLARLAVSLGSAPGAGTLTQALRDTLADGRLELRYWAPGRGAYVDPEGHLLEPVFGQDARTTQVRRNGHPVALLVHSPHVDGARLDRALGAALRLALQNEQLRAATLAELDEVQASRTRIVERARVERHRLERNLHDGAQQRVIGLSLMVRMLAGRAQACGDAAVAGLAAQAIVHVRSAVEELRRVARGIYPAVLSDAGLHGAVQDLAESSTDLAVVVDTLPARRYTGAVETTAYQVVAAAIAEARRCGASKVRVRGEEHAGVLRVELIADCASDPRSTLHSLTDQVVALSGRLVVEAPDGGNRVLMELPCGS
jgi:signal transduction histidine kinase